MKSSPPVHTECVRVDVAHLADEGLPKGGTDRHIGLQNVLDIPQDLRLSQRLCMTLRLGDDLMPRLVGR